MMTENPFSSGRRDFLRRCGVGVSLAALSGHVIAQEGQVDAPDAAADASTPTASRTEDFAPITVDPPVTETWRFGMVLETPATLANVHATFPIPKAWPEQKVEIANQAFDSRVRYETRDLPGELARQVIVAAPRIVAGSSVNAYVDLRITKHNLALPPKTEGLMWPTRTLREMRMFTGTSPNIDTRNGLIIKAYRELVPNLPSGGWERVEAIYDYVRTNVQYLEGPIQKASDALKTGKGDCEDMTSLFVALCRNAKVPARMVWIPGHCYPEFYLQTADGVGHWYPCQAAGTRAFGEMKETRPIMQKGDKFKVPESKVPVRYLAETFRCAKSGRGNPKPKFLMEKVG